MPGFIRRYTYVPSADVLAQIEGFVILDLPPPGAIEGVGVGVACLIGEFQDMTYAVKVAGAGAAVPGAVSTNPVPVEIYSAQDLIDKLGGFDSTIGKFGSDCGNGFMELRNKKFSRLVCVPINLCSGFGVRVWRELPCPTSATDPTPVVPIVPASVPAGREFINSASKRVRLGASVKFTDTVAYLQGVDGSVTISGGVQPTQTFNSAGSNFVTAGVKKGDILVLNVYGANNANQYRVVSVTTATAIVVEKMSGVTFDWLTQAAMPWRLHIGETADSGPANSITEVVGCSVPARPLDALIAAAANLTPVVVPPARSATSCDPLSGLASKTDPTTGLAYEPLVQAPNAANGALLEGLYSLALDSLLTEQSPGRDVNIVWCARKMGVSGGIPTALRTHVLNASALGRGRCACISPRLTDLTFATNMGTASPGVGATRDERCFYSWPGLATFVREAVGTNILNADGKNYSDGNLDVTSDGWLAAILSNLAPERNPGQAADPVKTVMSPVLGFQHAAPVLNMNHYIAMKAQGICAPRISRNVGPIFQSGVTTSLTSGQTNINRRRMADFVEDSIAERMVGFSKLPLSQDLQDQIVGEHVEFFEGLLSSNNPKSQRISAYALDAKSGNTAQLRKKGIYVVRTQVEMLATADVIVGQIEVGLGVLNVKFS